MKEYNLLEAAENVAQHYGMSTDDVLKIANGLVADFKRQLTNLDEIHITRFGSFRVKSRMFRVNLFTNIRKKKLKVVFKASDVFENEINTANL